jgi:hypothetical protein
MCLKLTMRTWLIIRKRYHSDRAKSRDVPVSLAMAGEDSGNLTPSLRGALATKQSSLPSGPSGLLRCARNDGERTIETSPRHCEEHLRRSNLVFLNATDTRGELGGHFDDLTVFRGMPLILRAQVAWAHDWVSNPALNASFESLPGTSFTVFGAPIPHDSALTSASAQLFFTPNWSLQAKFDGEFASGSQVYAGSGTLRYTW